MHEMDNFDHTLDLPLLHLGIWGTGDRSVSEVLRVKLLKPLGPK